MKMMFVTKHAAALAVAASVAAVAPASAATFLAVTNSSPVVCTGLDPTCNFILTGEVDTAGAFSVTSNLFVLPTSGIFAGTATNTATNTTNINYATVVLRNTSTGQSYSGTVSNGIFDLAFSGPNSVSSGLFALTLTGTATTDTGVPPSNPSIGGTASFTAALVPEPASWALFILGFGVIGAALRRNSDAVRVSKTRLRFT